MQPTVVNDSDTVGFKAVRGRPRKTPPETASSYSSTYSSSPLTSPLSSGPAAKRVRIDLTPSVMSSTSTATPPPVTIAEPEERCFVCDTNIVGKKYSLASCMTNGTKVRLVEVLGRLVSDSYMVVVSHGEHICRGCANLLNTLDRLEAEISSVKRIVLNFVERKYRLGDRLQNQLVPAPVVYSKTVPSNIPGGAATRTTTVTGKFNANASPGAYKVATPSTTSNYQLVPAATSSPVAAAAPKLASALLKTPNKGTSNANPAVRTKAYKITLKDEQVLGQSQAILQSAEQQVMGKTSAAMQQTTTPKNVWMQCNQCQYTTNQRAVMLEHLRQHVAARTPQSTSTEGVAKGVASSSSAQQAVKPALTTIAPKPTAKSSDVNNGVAGTSKPTQPMIQVHSSAAKPNEKETATKLLVSQSTGGGKPALMLTIGVDGKVTTQSGGKSIILRKTTAPNSTTTSTISPGIVSRVLASPSTSVTQAKSSMSQLFTSGAAAKAPTTSTAVTSQVKVVTRQSVPPVVPATPKVFTSSAAKSSGPEPSLPMLIDDL